MAKRITKQKWINYIMKHAYSTDRPENRDRNLAYLNSLSDKDLEDLYDDTVFEVKNT